MKTIFISILITVLLLGAGCAGQEFYTHAAPETVRALRPGITTPSELLLAAGDPDSIVKMEDGTEVYTWLDTVVYTRGLSAFPLWVIGGSKRTSSETHYLEVHFRDGVMTSHRYLSTLELDEEDTPFAASGDLMPGPDPAVAPQFSETEGEMP